jgi:hypothetical protein
VLNIGKLAAGQQAYYLDLARVDDYYTGRGERRAAGSARSPPPSASKVSSTPATSPRCWSTAAPQPGRS